MPNYRRAWVPGGTYFFTVTLANRRDNSLLVDRIDALRQAVRDVRHHLPFEIDAMVVLPEHLHAMWTLPEGVADFATRWKLIKGRFSHACPPAPFLSKSQLAKGERGIWQRRYFEHLIRDEGDFAKHADYIHYNPVKHGCVPTAAEWPYSTFHSFVEAGIYASNWGADVSPATPVGE
ncbi:MAG: transposase [Pseudomonadota bacterium]|nr:transposase [Pseudomonadota bacterium]